jgi:hypothetical protein
LSKGIAFFNPNNEDLGRGEIEKGIEAGGRSLLSPSIYGVTGTIQTLILIQ